MSHANATHEEVLTEFPGQTSASSPSLWCTMSVLVSPVSGALIAGGVSTPQNIRNKTLKR